MKSILTHTFVFTFILFAAPFFYLSPANAATDWSTIQSRPLHVVYSKRPTPNTKVSVQFALDRDQLLVRFDVRNPHLNAKALFGPKDYPFSYDVVEVFLSVEGAKANLPYYEFEVSPHNQTYLVKIIDPKKQMIGNFPVEGFQSSTNPTAKGWEAELSIPLRVLGWNGDSKNIVGNAYSISGASPNRTYWGLSLPVEKKPNFHLPQYFAPWF